MKQSPSTLAGLILLGTALQVVAQTPETHSFLNLDRPILDGNASGLSDHRSIASSISRLAELRIKLHVSGEFNGDLYAYVRHVSTGATNFCVLLNRPGRSTADAWGYADRGLNVTFSDAAANGNIHTYHSVAPPAAGTPLAGSWRPDGRDADPLQVLDTTAPTTSLAAFLGTDPEGEWTLFVADVDRGANHTLVGWELEFIGGLTPDVTWSVPADITYGTALSATQLNATSSVPGDFVYSPPAGTQLNAGPAQTLSVTFTPADTTAYVPVTRTVDINVLPKPLTITATSLSKVYGAALPTLTWVSSGFVNGDTEADLDTPPGVTTAATASSPVGPYPITPGGATDPNYAITFVDGVLTVNPASTSGALTTSANPAAPGQPVTFTLQVAVVAPGAGVPTGNVQFVVDGAAVGPPVPLSGSAASITLAALAAGGHTVAATYSGDGDFAETSTTLAPSQLINTPPTPGADTIFRFPTDATKVLLSTLLSNDTDADGDPIQFLSFSPTSAHGAALTRDGDWIHYTPPDGFTNDDSFTYTIEDVHQAPTTVTVTVLATTDAMPSPNLLLTEQADGSFLLKFDGIPGKIYRIQYAEALPTWLDLGSAPADDVGRFQYTDIPPAGTPRRFYRSVYP